MGGWLRVVRHGVTYEAQMDLRTWLFGVNYARLKVHPSPARHCLNVFIGCLRFSRDWSVKGPKWRVTWLDALQVGLIAFVSLVVASLVWAAWRFL